MKAKINGIEKDFDDVQDIIVELAFAHYPVEVEFKGINGVYSSFDEARLSVVDIYITD